MRDKYEVEQDPYCYPSTDILINQLDIKDAYNIDLAERDFTVARYKELIDSFTFDVMPPLDGSFLKDIHYHLFQDLYEWAGEYRNVAISKDDTRFCQPDRISPEIDKLFKSLAKEKGVTLILTTQPVHAASWSSRSSPNDTSAL